MNSAKIVVVGAGASGIAAATKLLELGFQQVYLVEAENRIGGRINTVPYGENVVDLGAQWCHGEKGNVVYNIASKHNLLERSGDIFNQIENIRSNKEKLPTKVNQQFKQIIDEILGENERKLAEYVGSFGAYVTELFFEALKRPEYSDIDMVVAREFLELFKKYECSEIACDNLEDASAKGQMEYWDCDGDPDLHWKDKGYLSFLRLLLKSDVHHSELGVLNQRVMFGKRVKTIVWKHGGKVKLICEDDDEILANHVIVTVSLGVLKAEHARLFQPSLPRAKIRSIEGLGFGIINKVILEFPSQFWPENWGGFNLLWRNEDLMEIRGTHLAWLEGLFSFDPAKYKPRVLFGWVIGPHARRMEELSDENVLSGCMYLLRKFLEWHIPTPTNILRSTWHSNENFRGCYSFHSMLTDETRANISDLGSPLQNPGGRPVVLFAGEATSIHHFSTVHGAVETGWREAKRIAKFYNSFQNRKC